MIVPAFSLAVALMAQATPAAAPSPVPQASPHAVAASAGDPVICHSINETGSRFSRRECHTAAEWRAISDAAQQQVQRDQRMSSQSPH